MSSSKGANGRRGSRRVAVVGGGLAGLAAAVRLSQLGLTPVVLEKRPFLGGRAFSFIDQETGVEVDNGQHVFVGACDQYIAFLRDIGAWGNVTVPRGLDAPVLHNGVTVRLRSTRLPGSLANLGAILRYRHLSIGDRLRVVYGMARLGRVKAERDPILDAETFDSWLLRHGQNADTIARFWNLIVLPALNDDVSVVSAAIGIMLFQTALLGSSHKAAIGYPVVGLSSLAGDAASQFVVAGGGEMRMGASVQSVTVPNAGGSVNGLDLTGGETLPADAVILALPAGAMLDLLPEDLTDSPFFRPASDVETAPIVGVHIWYDRQVLDDPFVAVLDSPLQWVFNVTRMHREAETADSEQHIVISLSGAWKWKDRSKAELREVFVSEMGRVFPRAAEAEVTRFLIVKMLEATFRVTPGAAANRLPQTTPISNLFLAGDWTQTGWPSTMESAVRSGNLAAEAAARHLSGAG